MAIGEKLEYLNGTKTAIKGALQNRGVTVSDTDTFRSYADKVGQIGETVEKTKFGTSIDTFFGDIDENGVLQNPTWTGVLNFAGVKEIVDYGLYYMFYNRTGITSIDLSSLQTIGSYGIAYTFYNCTGITSIDLSSLQTIDSYGLYYAFYSCTGITSVDLSSLQTAKFNSLSNTFRGCTALTSIDLSSLQTIGSSGMSYAFYNCKNLTTISFPSLTSVQSNSFGAADYDAMFYGCTALTEIHFRADMQATIEAMLNYSKKWGATSSTIYFDL